MSEDATIHGVAIAVGDLGVLVLGDSGSGKSSLAGRMIADWPLGHVSLVADDRVRLSLRHGRLIARPHPAIAGQLEVRGYGLVQVQSLDAVVIGGVLQLQNEPAPRLPERRDLTFRHQGVLLPSLILPNGHAAYARLVISWPDFSSRLKAE
jgi:HPr kinase/phosphorylase